jgi:hypothetical protein
MRLLTTSLNFICISSSGLVCQKQYFYFTNQMREREGDDLRGSVINLLDFIEILTFTSCDMIFIHSFGVEFGSEYPRFSVLAFS